MKIPLRRFFLSFLLLCLLTPCVQAAPQTLKSYADRFFSGAGSNPTQEAFTFIRQVFRENGASVRTEGRDGLDLKVKPFTDVVNSYDNGSVTIKVAAMPSPAQADAYWANWNRVLANGKWAYHDFFRSRWEMQTLARYNTLVLTAHEYGHYFDYRYNVSGYRHTAGGLTSGKALNCTEYLADKFAVAFINYLCEDSRFAALRPRYYALINSFNRSLPAQNRMVVESYEQLENDCGSINILKNGTNPDGTVSPNYFRQYASAYFGRHRVLLDKTDFPALPVLVRQLLTSRLPKLRDYTNDAVSIRQVGDVRVRKGVIHIAFGPRGALWQFEVRTTPFGSPAETLNIHIRDGKGKTSRLQYNFTEYERVGLEAQTPIIFGDNELLIPFLNDPTAQGIFDRPGDTVYLLLAQRQAGGAWRSLFVKFPKLPRSREGDSYYNWTLTPGGKFLLFHTINGERVQATYRYLVNLEKLTLSGKQLVCKGRFASAVNLANDSRYFGAVAGPADYNGSMMIRELGRKDAKILLGNGLDGFVAGPDKTQVELTAGTARRFLSNTILRVANLLGYDERTGDRRYLIRDITIKAR